MHIVRTKVSNFYGVSIKNIDKFSLLKCLSIRLMKYFPMLILVSLQNGGLKQMFFSISGCLIVWISNHIILFGYILPNQFYTYNHFYFNQFNLAGVHSLIVKNISI